MRREHLVSIEGVFDARIGIDRKIYRWAPGSKIPWRIDPVGARHFSGDFEDCMVRLMNDALEQWQLPGLGLEYPHVSEQGPFTFQVTYRHNDQSQEPTTTLATAFFPGKPAARRILELVIYPAFFQLKESEKITTLIHEIGHTLGMRHDPIPPSELESYPCIQLEPPQTHSVMHFEPTLYLSERSGFIHKCDVSAAVRLYGLQDTSLHGWTLVDVEPQQIIPKKARGRAESQFAKKRPGDA
ncbi:hypothetical protein ANO14919_072780 [Xylariales sp. No.14919]|nr:hypothetical protein ANO14919_072780 [Xylariales sp. No.14919]